jgi:tryptophan synthase alpha chain
VSLQEHLCGRREAGASLLVPYLTAGLPMGGGRWTDALLRLADAGADAIEVGIPFSDPVMDGPVIQAASHAALVAGTTPRGVLGELSSLSASLPVPVAVMCYYNTVHAFGLDRFAAALADSGVEAAIVPDLPIEESGPWRAEAARFGVETVMLAAPTSPPERLVKICEASSGFVYGVGVMGVTGTRESLAQSAIELAGRLKATTAKPVLIGVGVSDADQARKASEVADGVVIGSAVVERLMGEGIEAAGRFVESVRQALR